MQHLALLESGFHHHRELFCLEQGECLAHIEDGGATQREAVVVDGDLDVAFVDASERVAERAAEHVVHASAVEAVDDDVDDKA